MLFSFSVQDTKILPLDEVNLNALDKRLLKTSSKSWLSVFTKIFSSNSVCKFISFSCKFFFLKFLVCMIFFYRLITLFLYLNVINL